MKRYKLEYTVNGRKGRDKYFGSRKAAESYNKAKKKITEGGQSINTTARRLIALGAKQNDRNPLPQMMDIDDIPVLDMPQTADTSEE